MNSKTPSVLSDDYLID